MKQEKWKLGEAVTHGVHTWHMVYKHTQLFCELTTDKHINVTILLQGLTYLFGNK